MGFSEKLEELKKLNSDELENKRKEMEKEFFDNVKNLSFQQSEDLIDMFLIYGNLNWRLGLGK